MLFYYTVYAKVDCGYCATAINNLNEHGLDHVLILVDKSEDFYSVLKKRYDHQTVPMIVKSSKVNGEDVEFIGGCDDFMQYLKEQGYEKC